MVSCTVERHRSGRQRQRDSLHSEPMTVTIRTVNLEAGMPPIPQARARLASEVQAARAAGVTILKVIHGYGSTGVGGDLRIALQSTLRQMAECGEIRACIYGENWRKSDESSWNLIKRFPTLKDDRDFGRGNKGITIVVP